MSYMWHWQDEAGEYDGMVDPQHADDARSPSHGPADQGRVAPPPARAASFSPMVATEDEMAYMIEYDLVKCLHCGNIWDGCSQCLCNQEPGPPLTV